MIDELTGEAEARREACEPIRELNEADLNAVSGGKVTFGDLQIQKYIDKASISSPSGPPEVWVGCGWVPQWW
jgi:hypothetical protein